MRMVASHGELSRCPFRDFSEQLVVRCIEAGCPPGGTVSSSLLGAGTVAVVAERLGRNCIGIELNPEYAQQARERILQERAKLAGTSVCDADLNVNAER